MLDLCWKNKNNKLRRNGGKEANHQKAENERRQPLSLKMVTMETVPFLPLLQFSWGCTFLRSSDLLPSFFTSVLLGSLGSDSWQLRTSDSSLGVYNLWYKFYGIPRPSSMSPFSVVLKTVFIRTRSVRAGLKHLFCCITHINTNHSLFLQAFHLVLTRCGFLPLAIFTCIIHFFSSS